MARAGAARHQQQARRRRAGLCAGASRGARRASAGARLRARSPLGVARPRRRELVRGAQILPWSPKREINAEEARALRGGAIPRGEVRPPDWAVPAGFPDPGAPVRALLDGALVALLRERDGMLWREIDLRRV